MDKIQALKVFIAVAKANSFNIAADRLELSPPMVSRYIAWLEQSIQARLFNRTTRRLSLTEAGRDYFHRSQQVLEALEEADASVAQGATVRGTLRMTAPPSFGENQLMPMIFKFMKEYPAVHVELTLDNRRINLVDEGIDLAIRIALDVEPGLIVRKLCECRTVICASPDYIKRHGQPTTLDDFENHESISFSFFQDQSWQFVQDGKNKIEYADVQGKLKINNIDAVVHAAVAGFGLTHLPTFLAGDLIRAGKLVEVSIPGYHFLCPSIFLAYPSREFLPPKVRVFIDMLTQWVQPMPPWDVDM